MLMKSADGCSEQYKYQLKEVLLLLFSIIIMIDLNLNICFVHLLQQLQQLIPVSVSSSRDLLSSEWMADLDCLFWPVFILIPA